MGVDMRGDPAGSLAGSAGSGAERHLRRHYIDLPFDLSDVTFIATANYRGNIPDALRDRMEIIEVPGYTRSEKRSIAEQFLGAQADQRPRHHERPDPIRTRGHRAHHRLVHAGSRRARSGARDRLGLSRRDGQARGRENLLDHPGEPGARAGAARPERNLNEINERKLVPGIAIGLAVSGSGGDILIVECTRMPGKGDIRITGGLRDVMKESAATAVSYVRSKADRLKLDPEWLKTIDLHLHVPRGGSSRDGANAGVAMFVAVASLLLDAPRALGCGRDR